MTKHESKNRDLHKFLFLFLFQFPFSQKNPYNPQPYYIPEHHIIDPQEGIIYAYKLLHTRYPETQNKTFTSSHVENEKRLGRQLSSYYDTFSGTRSPILSFPISYQAMYSPNTKTTPPHTNAPLFAFTTPIAAGVFSPPTAVVFSEPFCGNLFSWSIYKQLWLVKAKLSSLLPTAASIYISSEKIRKFWNRVTTEGAYPSFKANSGNLPPISIIPTTYLEATTTPPGTIFCDEITPICPIHNPYHPQSLFPTIPEQTHPERIIETMSIPI